MPAMRRRHDKHCQPQNWLLDIVMMKEGGCSPAFFMYITYTYMCICGEYKVIKDIDYSYASEQLCCTLTVKECSHTA